MPKVLPEYLEQRRRQILEAAAECFAGQGFHQTSMQDICDKADLSPGAIYRYFRGKDEIIAAICEVAHEQDLVLIEAIKERADTFEVMEQLGRTFFRAIQEGDARLHIEMLSEAPRSRAVLETAQQGNEAIIQSFAAFVRQAQAKEDVNPDIDAEAVAHVMCAMYMGYLVQRQLDRHMDADRYFDTIMALFNGGFFTARAIAPRPAAALAH